MENYFKSAEQTQSVLEALKCYWDFFGERSIDEEDDDLTFFSNGFFSLVNPQNYHRQIYDNRCQLFAPEVIDFPVFENGYYALSVVKNNSYQFFNPQGESIACFDDVIFCGQYRHFVVKKMISSMSCRWMIYLKAALSALLMTSPIFGMPMMGKWPLRDIIKLSCMTKISVSYIFCRI